MKRGQKKFPQETKVKKVKKLCKKCVIQTKCKDWCRTAMDIWNDYNVCAICGSDLTEVKGKRCKNRKYCDKCAKIVYKKPYKKVKRNGMDMER